MKSQLFTIISLFLISAVLAPACSSQSSKASWDFEDAKDQQIITDAYVCLQGRALVNRKEQMDFMEEGIGFNMIKYNPLASAGY